MLTLEEIREGAAGWDGLADAPAPVVAALGYLFAAVDGARMEAIKPYSAGRYIPDAREQAEAAMLHFVWLDDNPTDFDGHDLPDAEAVCSPLRWLIYQMGRSLRHAVDDDSERGVNGWKVGPLTGPTGMIEDCAVHLAGVWLGQRGFRVSPGLLESFGEQWGPETRRFVERVMAWRDPRSAEAA
jgi:hypothetical protein